MTSFTQNKNILDVEIGHINEANIEQLKTININTLPGRFKANVSIVNKYVVF